MPSKKAKAESPREGSPRRERSRSRTRKAAAEPNQRKRSRSSPRVSGVVAAHSPRRMSPERELDLGDAFASMSIAKRPQLQRCASAMLTGHHLVAQNALASGLVGRRAVDLADRMRALEEVGRRAHRGPHAEVMASLVAPRVAVFAEMPALMPALEVAETPAEFRRRQQLEAIARRRGGKKNRRR